MVDDMPDPDFERLAAAVRARRDELGLSLAAVRRRGGPAIATMQKIEGGQAAGYRSTTLRPLEAALRWVPGSVRVILDGGEPSESEPARQVLWREDAPDRPDLTEEDDIVSFLRSAARMLNRAQGALISGSIEQASELIFSTKVTLAIAAQTLDARDPVLEEALQEYQQIVHANARLNVRATPAASRRPDRRYDPEIHEPIAAYDSPQPTEEELREQADAAAEEAAMAEELRRQDESDGA